MMSKNKACLVLEHFVALDAMGWRVFMPLHMGLVPVFVAQLGPADGTAKLLDSGRDRPTGTVHVFPVPYQLRVLHKLLFAAAAAELFQLHVNCLDV